MKVFRGLPNAESRAPCALTIGNFDGVHRGHQALLARVRAAADARGLPVCVMTFEPHPREFFNPASAPPRIAMLRDKLEALERWVQGGFQPDLTVLFDVQPQVASARRGAVRMPDKFESESDAFFARTRAEYLRRAHEAPHRFAIVDSSESIPQIRRQLEGVLAAL